MSTAHPLAPARRQARVAAQIDAEARLAAVEGRLTDLVSALHGLVVNHVLDAESVTLAADGVLEKSWTVPFGSIAVMNTSQAPVTVVAATRSTDTAPKVGKGVTVIPAGASAVIPLTGRAVTFYGAAGASFFFAVFTTLMPPHFETTPTNAAGQTNIRPLAPATDGVTAVSSAVTVLNLAPNNAAAGVIAGSTVAVPLVTELAVDINLTAITGGTAPTVTFFLDRQGADGVWYRVWTSTAQSAAAPVSTSIGPGLAVTAALTGTIRVGTIFGGTVNPTGYTATVSVVGR